MSQNEAACIQILKEILWKKANEVGGQFNAYPLGPQDRNVLADDIFAAADYFAIVESKWSEDQLLTEAEKKTIRVKQLCEGLNSDDEMAMLHAKCHKIAWRDSVTEMSMLQPYRDFVCAESFPKTCLGLIVSSPCDADEFAVDFFGDPPRHCVPAKDFIRYVKWLLQTVTGQSDKSVVVLARTKNRNGKSISKEMTLEDLSAKLTQLTVKKAKSAIKTAEHKVMKNPKAPK